ncbi:MAG: LPS ABC transporter substrate-binding protein LptA [Xanthobacteraceae bacterium]|nr:LPS ABC transporter substrate-binding protein LptA [Xanthobacteraceae bacterium]
MTARFLAGFVAAIAAALLVVTAQSVAQPEKKSPGLFKGMPQKREGPVRITAATLEVRDKSKMATFKGDVQVLNGDTEVRCAELVVFYDDERDKSGAKKAPPQDGGIGNQQIRRMEARGNVVVTQKDQRAVGDRAEFDMRTNTVTLIGNVIITTADNVVRGTRMIVDLNTGIARMGETGGGSRVEGVFNSKAPPRPGK